MVQVKIKFPFRIHSVLAALGSLQSRAFMSLNHLDPSVSVSNYGVYNCRAP